MSNGNFGWEAKRETMESRRWTKFESDSLWTRGKRRSWTINPCVCVALCVFFTYPSVVSSMPTIGKQSIPGSRSTPSSRIGPRVWDPISLPCSSSSSSSSSRGTFFFSSRGLGQAAYRHTRVSLPPSAYILTVRASCVPQETRSLGPLQRHTTTHVLLMLALHPPRTRSSFCPLPTAYFPPRDVAASRQLRATATFTANFEILPETETQAKLHDVKNLVDEFGFYLCNIRRHFCEFETGELERKRLLMGFG